MDDSFLKSLDQKYGEKKLKDPDDPEFDILYDTVVNEAEKIIKEYFEKTSPGAEIWTEDHAHWIATKSIEELITNDEFLGLHKMETPETPSGVYPAVLEDCIELWEERKRRSISLAIFEESFGSGKTFKASILLWLQWIELCKYTNPQKHFNLADDSWIAFMCFSQNEKKARNVCMTDVWNRFKCPFNRKFFPAMPSLKREIRVNRNHSVVYAGTSSELSGIGYHLFGGILDECNFLDVVEDSKRVSADERKRYDEAELLCDSVINRMVSRYIRPDGTLPGVLVAISSVRYNKDFTDRKIMEAKMRGSKSDIFWKRRTTYEAKPVWIFPSKKYFYVDTSTYNEIPEDAALKYFDVIDTIKNACIFTDEVINKLQNKIIEIPDNIILDY